MSRVIVSRFPLTVPPACGARSIGPPRYLSEAELMSDAAVQARMQSLPRRKPYEIVHRNLYVTHQRVLHVP